MDVDDVWKALVAEDQDDDENSKDSTDSKDSVDTNQKSQVSDAGWTPSTNEIFNNIANYSFGNPCETSTNVSATQQTMSIEENDDVNSMLASQSVIEEFEKEYETQLEKQKRASTYQTFITKNC
jgi:hypothetical protein